MDELKDIKDVCALLGTTSRTLRFYEEKGLIHSTLLSNSARRKYTRQQIDDIKNVMVLRSLGIPVARIAQLKSGNIDLRNIIAEHRAEILCTIAEKQAEINILGEALHILEKGGDIFAKEKTKLSIETNDEQLAIAKSCTEALLHEDFAYLSHYFSDDMKQMLNTEALKHSWEMVLRDTGVFMEKGRVVRDDNLPNCVYTYLLFEKLGAKLKYVFHGTEICGLWFTYIKKEDFK